VGDAIGAQGWLPSDVWDMALSDVLLSLRAAERWMAARAVLTAAVIMSPLTGGGSEMQQRIEEMLSGDEEPHTLAEKYGPEVAASVEELQRHNREFIKRKKEQRDGREGT